MTILLDNGYHQEYLEQEIEKQEIEKQEIEKIEPELRSRIIIEIAEKVTPEQRTAAKAKNPSKQGFVGIKKRWIVERTNAWLNQCRVLWKNGEALLRTSEAKIRICAIPLILRRIT